MEIELKDLSSKIYVLKEIVDLFEYSDKTQPELMIVIKYLTLFHRLTNSYLSI